MGRKYYNLYPGIYKFSNLWSAYKQASRGKRSQPSVAAFEYDLENQLLALEGELQTQTYQPGGYHNFHITVPKARLISAAPFRDRVVHHALMNVIEPLFERQFIYDSYANRAGKGTHRAQRGGAWSFCGYRLWLPRARPPWTHDRMWGQGGFSHG